ncbi:antigen-presenting glycoprotein CD1d-like [Mantella aurantiaca]
MKVLLPFLTLSLLLVLNFTATGSIKLNWLQSYYVSRDGELTLWSSMEMEDVQILVTYNSTREFVFKKSWAKGNQTDDYWSLYNVFLSKYFSAFQIYINGLNKEFGVEGAFTVQCWAGFSSSLDNKEAFTYRLASEGEDLVHFNDAEKVWVAGRMNCSHAVQKILQEDRQALENIKRVKVQCQELATKFSTAGKEAFSRKVQPEVYITIKSSKSETEVICIVTGFYPKKIKVSLWKENKMEDVMSTETLPNGDGTYQITVLTSLNLTKQQSVYCRVEHSSLKEPLIVYPDNKDHRSSRLLVGIIVMAIFSVVFLACFVTQYKKRSVTGSPIKTWLAELYNFCDELKHEIQIY